MSLHSSHTDAGMAPTRISTANILQPRQYANPDSSVAATRTSATQTYAATVSSKPNANTSAVTERNAPMPWAKRFGGPGTHFDANGSAGVSTRVTNWPSG